MRRKRKGEWIVMGGAPGEIGHCTRCGEGLRINLPQRIEVIIAASKAFSKAHGACPPGQYVEKPAKTPEEWATGRDTGTSSLTIYRAITGHPSAHDRYDVPHDPQDFGRCYRLLNLFPTWKAGLWQTVAVCEKWKPFVDEWDSLAAMYEAAMRSREAGNEDAGVELYDRIKELGG